MKANPVQMKSSVFLFKGRDELQTGLLGRPQSKWKLTGQVNLRYSCRIAASLCFFVHFHFNSAFLHYCFYFYIGPILTTTATMLKGNLAK